jgi:CYTH domain-containing protein
MRTAADEAASPKYSAVERERRFLVDPTRRPDLSAVPHVLIEDHYLIGTRMRLRRMTDSVTGEIALKFAKKYESADPLARPMSNFYLDDGEYAALAALPAQLLRKRRHQLSVAGGLIGVDLFLGDLAGLELAEFDGIDAAALRGFVPPSWTVREVSDDRFFQGGHLATLDGAALAAGLAGR